MDYSLNSDTTSPPQQQQQQQQQLKQQSNNHKLPSILTKQYYKNNNKTIIQEKNKMNDEEYSSSLYNVDSKIFDEYIQANHDDIHDIILVMQSITNRQGAAICPLLQQAQHAQHDHVTFVLKPMIQHALNSTSMNHKNYPYTTSTTSTTTAAAAARTEKNNLIASAYISTEFNLELEQLDDDNQIRLIQLHGGSGTSDNDDDDNGNENENIAIFFMNDYVRAVYNAAQYGSSTSSSSSCSNVQNDKEETEMMLFKQNETIVQLFLHCIHHHGCNGRFIKKSKIQEVLRLSWKEMKQQSQTQQSQLQLQQHTNVFEECQPDQWIDMLIHLQLLLPRTINNNNLCSSTSSFWYSLPKMGIAAKSILQGRKKLIQKITRSYNKELKQSTLENNFNNTSSNNNSSSREKSGYWLEEKRKKLPRMTGAFHVRDILARNIAKVEYRASGAYIRLKK